MQVGIDRCIFSDGFNVRHVLDAIITEIQGTLIYRRQDSNTNGIDDQGDRTDRGGKG